MKGHDEDMTTSDKFDFLSRTEIGRRGLLRGIALAGSGLAVAAVIGCGDDDDDDDDGRGAATPIATATPAATGTPATGAIDYPARAPHSDAAVQSYAEDFHWSRVKAEAQPPNQNPRTGGVALLAAASFGLATLHPTVEPVGQWPFCFTHSNLLGMGFENPDWHNLTADWSVSESHEVRGETEVIFNLRPGVAWHDKPPANGALMTVEDVKATYDLYKASPLHADRFKEIESFDEPEPGVLRMQLTNPASHMLNLLRVPQFAILNAAHIEEGDDSLSTKAIGTGAFTQENFQPDTARVYKKNPNYWLKDAAGRQLPHSDGVVHQIIRDPAAALAGFRTKQVDAYKPTSIEQFDQLRGELDVFAQVHAARCACSSQQLAFSRRDPLFDDVRVRRAFTLAVNNQDIIDTVFGGAASQTGYVPWPWQGIPWPKPLSEMGEWYRHDPAEAQKLLAAAGVGDVKIPLIFIGELGPGGGFATADPYTESIKRDLGEVGVEFDLEALDRRGMNRVFFGQEWNGLATFGVGNATALDADPYTRIVETGAGLNGSGHSEPVVDQLILDFRAEYDFDARNDIIQKMDKYITEDEVTYGVTLPQPFGLMLWQKYMRNVIDAPAWWITGGAGQEFQEMWLTEDVPGGRDIDSF